MDAPFNGFFSSFILLRTMTAGLRDGDNEEEGIPNREREREGKAVPVLPQSNIGFL